jgi:uncharacterized protein YneR
MARNENSFVLYCIVEGGSYSVVATTSEDEIKLTREVDSLYFLETDMAFWYFLEGQNILR